jgi:hypothetical protein
MSTILIRRTQSHSCVAHTRENTDWTTLLRITPDQGALPEWRDLEGITFPDRRALRRAIGARMSAQSAHSPILVLVRGLPGSGKSTYARSLAALGYEHYEADQYFELYAKCVTYCFKPAELPLAHDWCRARVRNSLARGARCVVANTFSRRWEMAPYLDLGRKAGVPAVIIETRGRWPSIHGIPQSAIERMRARWEDA